MAALHTHTHTQSHTDTHTRTHAQTHTQGLLTVTFDAEVEASDIYAGGFIKVGPGGSVGGGEKNDHRQWSEPGHDTS